MNNEDKISKAWRAHDDADAEWLEVQRLAQIARDSGLQEPDEEIKIGWRGILAMVRRKPRE